MHVYIRKEYYYSQLEILGWRKTVESGIVSQTISRVVVSIFVSTKIGRNERSVFPPTFSLINAKIGAGPARAAFNDVACSCCLQYYRHKSEISNCSRKWVLITGVATLYALLTSV